MSAPRTLLLTGAAGGVGTMMRELLPAFGYELRLLDAAPVKEEGEAETGAVTAELGDRERLRTAVRGVDAIVHLAGISREATFEDILEANLRGTYHLYEAALEEGVRRVVFASSNHAIGFTPRPGPGEPLVRADAPHRPDTFYGLSKCFGEDLAQLYWDRYGIETVSLRIGSCFRKPSSVRMLPVWLSPTDAARLVDAALTADDVGHTVVYGSSANTRALWDLSGARALGYVPRDDSEEYAAGLLAEQGEAGPAGPGHNRIGGTFCAVPLGRPH
ncbi:NAD(P)-dependent oxidoreductase [Streptomyces sp. JJ36]|uniref:NAD-dependent epimerase/dehydratase family protein n=1 Tax=Streptomyces sp. JJ36 TaxID=2736645 RepID=UPI001F28DFF4|nr:NAD(P)-dependent oxidoreductase [Streptomyces sp. JJ36]MCF6523347.1 NAD(P)-dependent oxidoreductase [Streptomyces sp. JJ36]